MQGNDETDVSRTLFGASLPPAATGAGARLPVLVVLRGAEMGRRYLLNESGLVIGRRADRADLVVPGDPRVSSAHCRIERGPGPDSWFAVDLESTNGTFVGTERVARAPLKDGDRLHLGETVLRFGYHDELEEAYHREVDRRMNVDELTGLPVQRVFSQRLQLALAESRRRNAPLALFMLDMDGLKRINDTHGHQVGAHSIATVGRRLGEAVGAAGGVVSRFGGDEFSVFVPGAGAELAAQLGEGWRRLVADQPVTYGSVAVAPTVSIGFAVRRPEEAVEALVRRADEALYQAKAAGRNCVRG